VPLSSANVIQTNKGSWALSNPALLSATTAGNTVIIESHTEGTSGASPDFADFDTDYLVGLRNTTLQVRRQADTVGGQTTWAPIFGSWVGSWVVYEISGLYPAVDAYTYNSRLYDPGQPTSGMLTGETLDTNLVTPSDADVFCLSVWAAEDSAGVIAPTWAGYNPSSFVESQEQGAVGSAVNSLDLASAHAFPGSTSLLSVTATLTVSGGHSASGACVLLVYRSTADPLIFLTGFSPGTAVSANVGTSPYIPLVVGTPAVVADVGFSSGYAAEITASAATEGYGLDSTVRVGGSQMDVGHARVEMPSPLPTGDVNLVTIDNATVTDHAIRFRASDGVLVAGLADGTGTPAVGPAVAAGGVYRLEWRHDFNGFTFEWRVDGVGQPTFTIPSGDTIANVYIGPATVAATVSGLRFSDWLDSVTAADYPLGDCRVIPLTVDPVGTVTLTGTATNWLTFTSNGTTTAWNATTARNNLDEVPFVFGASNDGVVQATASTTDHVDVPLTSYTLLPGEIVMGARMVILGWAVSATAATFGFRFHNGTTEEVLVAGTVNPTFSNSTTAPGWFAKMVTLANINTQGKIDGAQIRGGYSSDSTPDIGFSAGMIELAVRATPAPPFAWYSRPNRPARMLHQNPG